MERTFTSHLLRWATLISLVFALAAVQQPALAADSPVKKVLSKKGKAIRGRLPAHYSPVVNEEQREMIYKIQEEYRAKIDTLESQLTAIKKERDEKIAAILTADQKKQIEEASKAKSKPGKPAEPAPAASPTEKPAK